MIKHQRQSPHINHAVVRGCRYSKFSIKKERQGGGFEMKRKTKELKSITNLNTS